MLTVRAPGALSSPRDFARVGFGSFGGASCSAGDFTVISLAFGEGFSRLGETPSKLPFPFFSEPRAVLLPRAAVPLCEPSSGRSLPAGWRFIRVGRLFIGVVLSRRHGEYLNPLGLPETA